MKIWTAHALRYAHLADRCRFESFLFDDRALDPSPMDYYIWVLRSDDDVIVVDTGFDAAEAENRKRPLIAAPDEMLRSIGVMHEDVTTLIVTHLHYDHAGGLKYFPNATIHVQTAEMAFATGPCMCQPALRAAFTDEHICDAVRKLYAGRMVFHDGDGNVADGVTVHKVGGHSRGLQVVRVNTQSGWLCLASDAAHFYENFTAGKMFPIVVDAQEMLEGFDTLYQLASRPELIIPGHDPLVAQKFPSDLADNVFRLDLGPVD